MGLLILAVVLLPALALAGPRSGGSFGGRSFGTPGGGSFSTMPRSYSGGGYYNYNSGPSIHVFPGWGWGWGGGYGYGGGFGLFGTLAVLAVIGVAVAAVARAVRNSRQSSVATGGSWDDAAEEVAPGRAYLYTLQLALGRSARGIQDRLADFAARGDTASEAGLASLLQQTALELLREKDAIRYASADARGPMSMTNAETAMNGLALTERSRFQVERVRSGDGRLVRSEAPAEVGREALELVVVTAIVATRMPLAGFGSIESPQQLGGLLSSLGGVSADGLLGLEVIWTPADPNDSMTETDVMTTYPDLRSV
jgi:uncharacterized membrane protein